ncbi:hypothetical protein KY345_02185 [Candidatus Woesearchaeota archaeon]|nr:hypothetical protein [Candidatus Woesearchaeota archaeon]
MKNTKKPLCFGTYVGEQDSLCSRCTEELKEECKACSKEISLGHERASL